MYVKERFILNDYTKDLLQDLEPPFKNNYFGEITYYRTYSRDINGKQENWADSCIRVIEGTFSIRKDHYIKNYISWNEKYWQEYASEMGIALFNLYWSPAGRGVRNMGTDYVYEEGAMCLYNCSATQMHFPYYEDLCWAIDCLMLGVGVGFGLIRNDKIEFKNPKGSYDYVIEDSREGWVDSVRAKLMPYIYGSSMPRFIYDKIRPQGAPIKRFGGTASGPEPLKYYHQQIDKDIELYMTDKYYDSIMLQADLCNQAGIMVVVGNTRRSAEIFDSGINDTTFLNLKDYSKNPRRAEWGWMSNNSVHLEKDQDFERLGEIAKRVIENGEPGYFNLQNFQYGRIGKNDKIRKDKARNMNPCAEIPLEAGFDAQGQRIREVCNVGETYPTRCPDIETWYKGVEYCTNYCSTVALLPTHQPSTNRVVTRNRRIGVGITDFTGWMEEENVSIITKYLRKGYKIIRKINKQLANEAGIPESIRVSTFKPGGTMPRVAGKQPGAGYPNAEWMLRRIRIARNIPIHKLMVEANIPYEADYFSQNTDVFECPVPCGSAPPVEEISVWQQAFNLVLLQREWADNAVSNTLMFRPKWRLTKRFSRIEGINNPFESTKYWLLKNVDHDTYNELMNQFSKYYEEFCHGPWKIKQRLSAQLRADEICIYEYDPKHEEDSIEPLLAAIAPLTKSVSLLPQTDKGVYLQMPEEAITKEEYETRLSRIKKIDWSRLSSSDGIDEKFCNSDTCSME